MTAPKALIADLLGRGYSAADVARVLGVSAGCVRIVRHRLGLTRPRDGGLHELPAQPRAAAAAFPGRATMAR